MRELCDVLKRGRLILRGEGEATAGKREVLTRQTRGQINEGERSPAVCGERTLQPLYAVPASTMQMFNHASERNNAPVSQNRDLAELAKFNAHDAMDMLKT